MKNQNKITEGNSFALNIRQAVWRTLGGVIQPLLASELVDVHLYVGSGSSRSTATEYSVTADGDTISAVMPATLKRGVYKTWLTAIYNGREVASNCDAAFEIVAFDEHYQAYAPERVDAPMAVYLQPADVTDAELEQLKAEFRAKNAALDAAKAAAEQARNEYIAKAEALESVATSDDIDSLKKSISQTASESEKFAIEKHAKNADYLLQDIYNSSFFRAKNLSGYTLKETLITKPSIFNIIDESSRIISIDDDSVEEVYGTRQMIDFFPSLEKVRLINVKRFGLQDINVSFQLSKYLKEFIAPKLERVDGIYYFLRDCEKLELADLSNIDVRQIDNYGFFSNSIRLIDLIIGKNHLSIVRDIQLISWRPTEALLDDSTSLVKAGEQFSSNREKLLYNIREHIAENLPDYTNAGYSRSFGFVNEIFSIMDESTIERFTNKGWNVISV